jgi:hypothetical protein
MGQALRHGAILNREHGLHNNVLQGAEGGLPQRKRRHECAGWGGPGQTEMPPVRREPPSSSQKRRRYALREVQG